MNITNRLGLPEPLVAAIRHDEYSLGDSDISVTALIGPPRIRQLRKRNSGKMTVDASDMIWSLIGRLGHSVLEKYAKDGGEALVEQRMSIERMGWKISGQMDLLGAKIEDWKFCSRYVAAEGAKDEWVQQQNIYRLIAVENGHEVTGLDIIAIYRDWSKMAAARAKDDYPENQVEVFSLPLWPLEKTEEYLAERIRVHQAAETELPLCTEEERWAVPDKLALVKKGAKRATKLFEDHDLAEAALSNAGKAFKLEERPGESKRCAYFCDCLPFCTQGRELMQEKI